MGYVIGILIGFKCPLEKFIKYFCCFFFIYWHHALKYPTKRSLDYLVCFMFGNILS